MEVSGPRTGQAGYVELSAACTQIVLSRVTLRITEEMGQIKAGPACDAGAAKA